MTEEDRSSEDQTTHSSRDPSLRESGSESKETPEVEDLLEELRVGFQPEPEVSGSVGDQSPGVPLGSSLDSGEVGDPLGEFPIDTPVQAGFSEEIEIPSEEMPPRESSDWGGNAEVPGEPPVHEVSESAAGRSEEGSCDEVGMGAVPGFHEEPQGISGELGTWGEGAPGASTEEKARTEGLHMGVREEAAAEDLLTEVGDDLSAQVSFSEGLEGRPEASPAATSSRAEDLGVPREMPEQKELSGVVHGQRGNLREELPVQQIEDEDPVTEVEEESPRVALPEVSREVEDRPEVEPAQETSEWPSEAEDVRPEALEALPVQIVASGQLEDHGGDVPDEQATPPEVEVEELSQTFFEKELSGVVEGRGEEGRTEDVAREKSVQDLEAQAEAAGESPEQATESEELESQWEVTAAEAETGDPATEVEEESPQEALPEISGEVEDRPEVEPVQETSEWQSEAEDVRPEVLEALPVQIVASGQLEDQGGDVPDEQATPPEVEVEELSQTSIEKELSGVVEGRGEEGRTEDVAREKSVQDLEAQAEAAGESPEQATESEELESQWEVTAAEAETGDPATEVEEESPQEALPEVSGEVEDRPEVEPARETSDWPSEAEDVRPEALEALPVQIVGIGQLEGRGGNVPDVRTTREVEADELPAEVLGELPVQSELLGSAEGQGEEGPEDGTTPETEEQELSTEEREETPVYTEPSWLAEAEARDLPGEGSSQKEDGLSAATAEDLSSEGAEELAMNGTGERDLGNPGEKGPEQVTAEEAETGDPAPEVEEESPQEALPEVSGEVEDRPEVEPARETSDWPSEAEDVRPEALEALPVQIVGIGQLEGRGGNVPNVRTTREVEADELPAEVLGELPVQPELLGSAEGQGEEGPEDGTWKEAEAEDLETGVRGETPMLAGVWGGAENQGDDVQPEDNCEEVEGQDLLAAVRDELPAPIGPSGELEGLGQDSLVERISEEELQDFDTRDTSESETDLPVAELISDVGDLYESARAYVSLSIQQVRGDIAPDVEVGERLARQITDSIKSESGLLLAATDREQEFSVSAHSVNVTILGLRIAQTMGYGVEGQLKVGLAALLHEVGVVQVPDGLMHQKGDVRAELRQRPLYSARIAQKLLPQHDWLAQIVGQIYEREDGSGHPLGLDGESIRKEAKILGVADVLEACLHSRPYRKPLTGYQLIHELTTGGTRSFSHQIAKALLRSFSLYPYNEYVILSTGEVGQVREVNTDNMMRPQIRMLFDSQGQPLDPPRDVA